MTGRARSAQTQEAQNRALKGVRRAATPLQALIDSNPLYAGCESVLEVTLANRLERSGLPLGGPQFRFVEGRQYRWDRAWPEIKLAVEVQGGIWTNGAHARGSGIERDAMKLSLGAVLDWRVLVVTRSMIEDGTAVDLIRKALGVEP